MAKLLEQHVHPAHPRLYIQLRDDSRWLQAVAFIAGTKRQFSTRSQHLPTAYRLAEDWYKRQLRIAAGEEKRRDPLTIPIMEDLFKSWKAELQQPSKREWAEETWSACARFWEALRVTEIGTQTFKDFYKARRAQKTHYGKPPSNHTLHQNVILIRQVLNHAIEEGHISTLPPIPEIGAREANPRPWLTRQEWDHLCRISTERIAEALENPRLHRQRYDLDQQMHWMVGTMMRVGEMLAVRYRDCRVQKNKKNDWVLVAEVKGKRGIRTVIGRHEAAKVYDDRLHGLYEATKDLNALVFPIHHREAFTELLKAAGLHRDSRDGFERNFKSLRCTAISFAVLRGAPNPNLLLIARNAGTSIAMIDQFYARRLSAEMGLDELTKSW